MELNFEKQMLPSLTCSDEMGSSLTLNFVDQVVHVRTVEDVAGVVRTEMPAVDRVKDEAEEMLN